MATDFDPDDYSVVVKHRALPPKPWKWEIYCAGKRQPIESFGRPRSYQGLRQVRWGLRLRLISDRCYAIDIGNDPVDVLPREPMKVVQALRNPHHDRQLVMPHAPFEREDRPPDTERDPRPNARVPADEEDIWRIGTHHAIQVPWTHDNDAQAHPVASSPTERIVRRRQMRTRPSGRPRY